VLNISRSRNAPSRLPCALSLSANSELPAPCRPLKAFVALREIDKKHACCKCLARGGKQQQNRNRDERLSSTVKQPARGVKGGCRLTKAVRGGQLAAAPLSVKGELPGVVDLAVDVRAPVGLPDGGLQHSRAKVRQRWGCALESSRRRVQNVRHTEALPSRGCAAPQAPAAGWVRTRGTGAAQPPPPGRHPAAARASAAARSGRARQVGQAAASGLQRATVLAEGRGCRAAAPARPARQVPGVPG
jgi:hypothetical protein